MTIDRDPRFRTEFARTVASFPAGVALLQTAEETPFAIVAASFCAVSSDPPLIAVTVARTSPFLDRFNPSGRFSVSLLLEHQADLARRYAGSGAELDAAARPDSPSLDCEVRQVVEAGDHRLVIAAVRAVAERNGRPLIFWRRTSFRLHLDYPFLSGPDALDGFVRDFEAGALPKSAWIHAAHVATSAWYAFDRTGEELFATMKRGIIHFNECVGTVNGPDSGYHETLTRFWSQTIETLVRDGRFGSRFEAACAAVERFGEDRDYHRLFYRFDVVRDRQARREWIAPDGG